VQGVKLRNVMKQEIKVTSDSARLTGGEGYLVPDSTRTTLIGKVCAQIEVMGLKDTQEKAVKDILRQTINEVFSMDYGSSYIGYDFYSTILEMLYEQKKVAQEEGLPPDMYGTYAIQYISKSIN